MCVCACVGACVRVCMCWCLLSWFLWRHIIVCVGGGDACVRGVRACVRACLRVCVFVYVCKHVRAYIHPACIQTYTYTYTFTDTHTHTHSHTHLLATSPGLPGATCHWLAESGPRCTLAIPVERSTPLYYLIRTVWC